MSPVVRKTEPEPVPEPEKKLSGKPAEDSRHIACRDLVHSYWASKHPGDTTAPWDGSDGKRLKSLLEANPGSEVAEELVGMAQKERIETIRANPYIPNPMCAHTTPGWIGTKDADGDPAVSRCACWKAWKSNTRGRFEIPTPPRAAEM
jgi:hypothetical protein